MSTELNSQFAKEMLAEIKAEEEAIVRRRPTLTSWACRIPIGTLRQLRRAAKKHGVTQTDLVLAGLRRILPTLLDEEEMQRELNLHSD